MPRTNASARRACRLTAALAALALSLPVQAQRTKKGAAGKSAPAPTAPAKASPAPAPAEPPSAPLAAATANGGAGFWASRGPASMGVGVGLASGKGSGLAVHMDYGFVHTPPSWTKLELEWRLRAMYAMPSKSTDLARTAIVGYTPVTIPTGTEEASASVAEIGPFARVRLVLRPKLAAFADLGAGLAQTLEKVDRDEMYIGHTVEKQNVTTVYVGGAAGLAYDLSDRWRALLSLAYSAQIGSDYSAFLPSLGIAYRLSETAP